MMIWRLSPKGYLTIWLFFMFVTSFVVTNTVKGTIPSYVLSVISLPIALLLSKHRRISYITLLVVLSLVYITLQITSQILLLLVEPPNFSGLILVSKDAKVILRNSLLTQSLYLFCSLLTLTFVIIYYDKSIHDRYLITSLIVFVSIGYFFWLFNLLFGFNADFISNREYSDGLINPGQFQPIVVNGIWMSRFVSLTGEPSMYVFSMLPYFIYTIHAGYQKTALYILVSLVLTLSGTFLIGLFLYGLTMCFWAFNKRFLLYISIIIALITVVFLSSPTFRDIINYALISKLLQESDSGLDRFTSMFKHLVYFYDLPLPLMLTGMGFGFIRSPDLVSTLLVNTGIVGFLLFSILMLYPVFKLSNSSSRNIGLKSALVVTYFIMMTSVSEYAYPSLWLFLGIAYSNLKFTEKFRSLRINVSW